MRPYLILALAGCTNGSSIRPLDQPLEFPAMALSFDQSVDTELALDNNGREDFAGRGDELLYAAIEGASQEHLLAHSTDGGRTWDNVWQDGRDLRPLMIFENGTALVSVEGEGTKILFFESANFGDVQLPSPVNTVIHRGFDMLIGATTTSSRIDLPLTSGSGYDVRGGTVSTDPGAVQDISGLGSVVLLTSTGVFETSNFSAFAAYPRPDDARCVDVEASDGVWAFPNCPQAGMLTVSADKGQTFDAYPAEVLVEGDILTTQSRLRVEGDGRFYSGGWVSSDGIDWEPYTSLNHPWWQGAAADVHQVTGTGLHVLKSSVSDDPESGLRLLPSPWGSDAYYGEAGNGALVGLPIAVTDEAILARDIVQADVFSTHVATGWARIQRNGGREIMLDGRPELSAVSAHRWHFRRAPDGRVARMDDHMIAWSDDEGESFGPATPLWPDAPGPPPNGALWSYGPILEHGGRLLTGALAARDRSDLRSAVLISDDGSAWTALEHDLPDAVLIPTASMDGELWAAAFGEGGEDLGVARSDDGEHWELIGLFDEVPLPVGLSPSGLLVGVLHVDGGATIDTEIHLSRNGRSWTHWATSDASSLFGVPTIDDEGLIWAAIERADRIALHHSAEALP